MNYWETVVIGLIAWNLGRWDLKRKLRKKRPIDTFSHVRKLVRFQMNSEAVFDHIKSRPIVCTATDLLKLIQRIDALLDEGSAIEPDSDELVETLRGIRRELCKELIRVMPDAHETLAKIDALHAVVRATARLK